MYYKITDTENDTYKALKALRDEEKEKIEINKKALSEKIKLKWKSFLGNNSQQDVDRVITYTGFVFEEPEKVDLKVWKKDKNNASVFVPNRRYKVGREMADFLLNGLEKSMYFRVYPLLGMESPVGRFSFPYIEEVNGVILVWLGDLEIDIEGVQEITSKEFKAILHEAQ